MKTYRYREMVFYKGNLYVVEIYDGEASMSEKLDNWEENLWDYNTPIGVTAWYNDFYDKLQVIESETREA